LRASAGPADLRFADGEYTGTLVYTGKITFTGGSAKGGAKGTFDMTVNGGAVAAGEFHVAGDASSLVPTGGATATFTANGGFAGTSERPVMMPTSASFSGSATVQGIVVPFGFSFGAGELTPVPFTVESATCTLVVGDFVQAFEQALSSQGIGTDLYGRFVAVRGGAAAGSDSALGDLIVAANDIATAAASGTVDTKELLSVVEEAEAFSVSLKKNTKCGTVKDAGKFNLAITGLIADLLQVVVANPGAFGTTDLFVLMSIGVRVGAIGEGALDGATSDQIIDAFEQIFSDRLDEAIAVGSATDIETVRLAALAMGWTDLRDKAEAAQ
jgi:hypothetical protein